MILLLEYCSMTCRRYQIEKICMYFNFLHMIFWEMLIFSFYSSYDVDVAIIWEDKKKLCMQKKIRNVYSLRCPSKWLREHYLAVHHCLQRENTMTPVWLFSLVTDSYWPCSRTTRKAVNVMIKLREIAASSNFA